MAEKVTVVRYKCTICGQEYSSEEMAFRCETKIVEQAICQKGDAVKIERPENGGSYDTNIVIEDITIEPLTHRLQYWFITPKGRRHDAILRDGKLTEQGYR